MPNFKQGGKGFQMKGWSAFTKKDDYTPQSKDPDSMDYKPQSVVEDKKEEKPTIKVDLKTKPKKENKWKKALKKIGKAVLKGQPAYQILKAIDKNTGGKLSDAADKGVEIVKEGGKELKKSIKTLATGGALKKKGGSKTKAGKFVEKAVKSTGAYQRGTKAWAQKHQSAVEGAKNLGKKNLEWEGMRAGDPTRIKKDREGQDDYNQMMERYSNEAVAGRVTGKKASAVRMPKRRVKRK